MLGLTQGQPHDDQREGNTMNFEDLTPELQKKVVACSTPEELLALAKAEGYDLSDAELEQVYREEDEA